MTSIPHETAPSSQEPAEHSITTKALKGVPWTLAAFSLSRGFQLIGTLVIARLVPPREIGVVLTGLVVVNAFNLLSDNGLSISLVMREKVHRRLADTVFTLMLGIAAACVVAAWAFASPISNAFGSPKLADVLPILALTVITSTITWYFTNMLQREMLWRQRFAGQFALAFGYVSVAVPCAALGAGVWSLVAGQLAAGILASLVLWRAYPHPVRIGIHRREAGTALRESRPYVSQAATAFLSENLHFIAVSAILGPRAMALYSMSYRLSELPNQALSERVAEATVPAYVRMREDPARAAGTLMIAIRYLLLAALLPLAVLAAVAPDFVDAVLGPRWMKMDPILTTLCVWGAICILTGSLGWFLNANRGARFMAKVNLFRLCVSMPLIFVAAAVFHSLEVVAILLCVDITIELVPLAFFAHTRLQVPFRTLIAAVRLPALAAAVAVSCTLGTRLGLDQADISVWPRLILASAAGVLGYAACILLVDRHAVTELRGLVSRAIAR